MLARHPGERMAVLITCNELRPDGSGHAARDAGLPGADRTPSLPGPRAFPSLGSSKLLFRGILRHLQQLMCKQICNFRMRRAAIENVVHAADGVAENDDCQCI